MKTIALIFDFDDTLLPDSTSQFLESRDMDVRWFWKESVRALIQDGYEPCLAYLNRIIENTQPGKPLQGLKNSDLRDFGRKVGGSFYPGLNTLLKDLQEIARDAQPDIQIEFYIVSGGLQELVEGSELVRRQFSGVYACQFGEDEQGRIARIKRSVTFTEKTRYLFEINKGIRQEQVASNPYLVNKDVPPERRRIPFRNMIYVGDGLTDIPCFSLVKRMGGLAFGVFHPNEAKSARRALIEFLHTDRVISMHAPRYRKTDELGALLRAAVANVSNRIKLEQAQAVDAI